MSNIADSDKDIDTTIEENITKFENETTSASEEIAKQEKDAEEMEINGPEHSFMCGVVEGFYGRPWTAEQRKELFRRMEEMGLNSYLYAPKDDYKHRLFWREKYSLDESELLKTLIDEAEDHSVTFVYAISPGLDMVFGSQKEITALKEKLLQVKKLGCKAFALLFDDIDPVLCASDMEEFESSANAQASITNLMFEALDKPRFLFCPTEYCSSMASPDVGTSPYLKALGAKLDPMISVMWTGSKVVSSIISVASIKQLNKILRRKIMIWDNIHANDYDPKRVFLGPYKGRSTLLIPHISGVLTNPNCEFESNYIAMHTVATWWKCYKPATNGIATTFPEKETALQEKALNVGKKRTSSFELSHSDVESISSGRASETDSDSDSDYSSHDDGFFYTLPDSEHGDYDPSTALQKALEAWLPVFSWVKYPARKIIPRSGTSQVLPPIPNVPVNTRPVVPDITLTMSMTEPLLSTGQTGDTLGKSLKIETDSKSESVLCTVIGDSTLPNTRSTNSTSETSDCTDASTGAKTEDDKLTVDVVMTSETKTSPENIDPESIPSESPIDKNDSIPENLDQSAEPTNPKPTTADIEMQEENGGNGTEDKALEEMQTSPKNPLIDQMETEEVQEQLTPMITDDLESDVPMATAQIGSAVPTDEDMSAPSPATNVADSKKNKNSKFEIDNSFSKIEVVKTTDSADNPGLSTPKPTKLKEPILETYLTNPMTVEDLRVLSECFFLPYEHGSMGRRMVKKFTWLRENAIKLSRSDAKKTEKHMDKVVDWSEMAVAFEEQCREIQAVFNKVCACPNRALLYDIFPYLWDLKGVIAMLRSYVQWLARVEVGPDAAGASEGKTTAQFFKTGLGFLGPDPEPWAFRGGLSGEFQRLLPVSSAFDLFCQTLPLEPQVYTFVVRPYAVGDEKDVYDICYVAGNDGTEHTDVFTKFKQLPGDRLLGAMLTLSPEYCFVAEDEIGVCAYLVAALDAKKFWTKYEIAYLPEMRKKYEKPTAEEDKEMSEAEKMIVDFHEAEDHFAYGSDDLHSTHPSFLTLALHPRASSSILKSMLVCLLSALKSHHSCGVHSVISADSFHFSELYSKLGFMKVTSKDDEVLKKKNVKILGRLF